LVTQPCGPPTTVTERNERTSTSTCHAAQLHSNPSSICTCSRMQGAHSLLCTLYSGSWWYCREYQTISGSCGCSAFDGTMVHGALVKNHQTHALAPSLHEALAQEMSRGSLNRYARQNQASLGVRLGAATVRMRLASIQQPRRILPICQPQDTWLQRISDLGKYYEGWRSCGVTLYLAV
jgi:hypothetical protein